MCTFPWTCSAQDQKCLKQESEVAQESGNSHKTSNIEVRVFACPAYMQSASPSNLCGVKSRVWSLTDSGPQCHHAHGFVCHWAKSKQQST